MKPHDLSDSALRHLDKGRDALVEMLERFARQHGLSDPSGIAVMREAAEQAHDVRAGLRGARGFEQADGLTSSRITLIDEAELDFGLELEQFTRDVKEATESGLAHLHLRYLTLLDSDSEGFKETPVGPETVCSALSALVESQALRPAERVKLLEAWREDLVHELMTFYRALGKQLDEAGIKPKTLKVIVKSSPAPTPAAAASNDLDALRNALTGHQLQAGGSPASANVAPGANAGAVLTQLREWLLSHAREHREDPLALLASDTFRLLAPDIATSVEMIERVFERLEADAMLPGSVRAILFRLRIPLINRALEGDDLFRTASQTLGKLIDGVGSLADTMPLDADAAHPAVRTLEGIFAELLAADPLHNAALVRAAGAVGAFLERRNIAARSKLEEAETLATKAERREACRLLASRALHVLLDDAKSPAAVEFLSHHWIHVLVHTLYRKGDKHPDWRLNLALANEISLLGDATSRAAPDLVARAESALRGAGLEDNAVKSARDALSRTLASPTTASSTIEATEPELSISVARDYGGLSMVHHRGLADTEPRGESTPMPEVGAWVDLRLPSGTSFTARVQWVGDQRNAALVCEPDEGRCAIVTRRAIGALKTQGNFRIRGGAKLLERATQAALGQFAR